MGPATFEDYVTWYSWARANLSQDPIACHAAAGAATSVLAASGGGRAAAAAAYNAARDEAACRQTKDRYGDQHRYVEWFLWARFSLGEDDEHCHAAAQAAVKWIAAGGNQEAARDVART